MKVSIAYGIILLCALLALSFGTAFAEIAKDKVDVTKSLNSTNVTINVTKAILNSTNTTIPQNTIRDVTNVQNITKLQNSGNPFAKARGSAAPFIPGGATL